MHGLNLCSITASNPLTKPGYMYIKVCLFCLFAVCLSFAARAQTYTITGRVLDGGDDTSTLIGVSVQLMQPADTSLKTGAVTDAGGLFTITDVTPGAYRLTITYVGFEKMERTVNVLGANVALGDFKLKPLSTQLQGVQVVGVQTRVEQLGDTTQFNAGAYKTNPDATAEELIAKMPGITTENGTVKVNGEQVQKVLVDGQEFFGEDATTALKNLPSEVIDKIQVFDRLSDQSQFSGFDDGNTQKTINIVTKTDKRNGQFGKVYAGYGTDERYIVGGNLNYFNGDARVSVIGLSNNINQQNFAAEDLLGVVGTSSGGGRGGGGPRGGRSRGGGGDASNFLVGQQGGITRTNALGLNYTDNWGKKIKVTGSYFFNQTNNGNTTDLSRQYITTADSNLLYKENSISQANNTNHRVNLRLEYNIDSFNSIILQPRLSFQDNDNNQSLTGYSILPDSTRIGETENISRNQNIGYNFSNNLLYRHRFGKKGRTISLNIGTAYSDRSGTGSLFSLNEYAGGDTTLLDQQSDNATQSYTLSGNITYTEPITEKSQLMITYRPEYTDNKTDKRTYDNNNGEYTDLNTPLSNTYDNTYTRHRGGLSYRYNTEKMQLMGGVNGEHAELDGVQQYPVAFNLQKTFTNVLPEAMLNFKFSKTQNLRVRYRTDTDAPSISQLQSVIDNSNPLLLRTGNPDLVQSYEHMLYLRYGSTNTTKATNMMAFLYGSYTNNYIGNSTIIPNTDTTFADGTVLNPGSQLSRPVNLDGYVTGRAFFTYGLPINFIKSNLNLNTGFNYNRLPALINNELNLSNNYTISQGVTLGSNISEDIDFTVSYTGNYNIVKNTLQQQSDNNYYSQVTSLRFNWIFLDGFVLNTNLNHTLYSGLGSGFNQNYLLWNAYFGYKFLKNRALEAKVSVFDILNQNNSIARNFTDTYVEDTRTDVLNRFFMFTLTYTLRNFGSGSGNDNTPQERGPRGGMPPPGGGMN